MGRGWPSCPSLQGDLPTPPGGGGGLRRRHGHAWRHRRCRGGGVVVVVVVGSGRGTWAVVAGGCRKARSGNNCGVVPKFRQRAAVGRSIPLDFCVTCPYWLAEGSCTFVGVPAASPFPPVALARASTGGQDQTCAPQGGTGHCAPGASPVCPCRAAGNCEFVVGEMASQPCPPLPLRAVPLAQQQGAQVCPRLAAHIRACLRCGDVAPHNIPNSPLATLWFLVRLPSLGCRVGPPSRLSELKDTMHT